jgi:CPA2 family monovalent cation:H+ antiporter-2
MVPENLFFETLIVILACAGTVTLFAQLGFPTVLGYLATGLVIGPHGLGILTASEGVHFLAELGVIFLLFMVGLEFSLPKMIAARKIVFGLGGLHVTSTTTLVTAGAIWLGFDARTAIVLGGAVAMSSTAVVLKQLADQGEISTEHGRIIMGILLFEDLAALAFLVLVDAWKASGQAAGFRLAAQVATAAIAFGVVGFVSRPILKIALARVARLRSNESMLLNTLALAFGTAFLAHELGISPPIGAFLAGMMIGETDFRHQVEDDIRPFRDALLGLFFVTVGMEIDLAVITGQPVMVLVWLMLLGGKSAIIAGVIRGAGWPWSVAGRAAACMAQGSEFSFLLLKLAISSGIMTGNAGQPALAAIAVSMGVVPFLIQRNELIGRLMGRRERRPDDSPSHEAVGQESEGLDGHIILLGCGRVGRLVASVLDAARVPYLAIESDFQRFREAQRRGHRILLADGSRARVLRAPGLRNARLLVITFAHRRPLERALHHARHENQNLSALVSVEDDCRIDFAVRAGASVVYPENLAAGLGLGDQALLLFGLSQDEAAQAVASVRLALYPELGECVGC